MENKGRGLKINIAWQSKNRSGGGHSFTNTFRSYMSKIEGVSFVNGWKSADIVLIPSASVITKELFREMKEGGAKIVLRVDNALKDSRNSGSGMARLKEFSQGAKEVVYQGKWAREYLYPFTGREGVIIHNGVDQRVFRDYGETRQDDSFVYACASKGETKQWEWAWYEFQMAHRENPNAILHLVGRFPDDVEKWGFNFFMGERYIYHGFIDDPREMAKIYNQCDYLIAPYTNDAFSQTYLEALSCGCELYHPNRSGGTPEILSLFHRKGVKYFSAERMSADYFNLFQQLL